MYKKEKRICKKVITSLLTTTMALGMFSSTGTLKVKAENENPDGYLNAITDNLGEVQNSWYIEPDATLYATLTGSAYTSSYTDAAHALEISTAGELAAFAKAVNEGSKDFENKFIKLTADININSSGVTFTNSSVTDGKFTVTIATSGTPANLWKAIGNASTPFKGTFDGDGHNILNMIAVEISSNKVSGGLFGVTEGATIQNVGIDGTSRVFCSSNFGTFAGGLIGTASSKTHESNESSIVVDRTGQIINCHSNCDIYSLCSNGTTANGGLVAKGEGTISRCYTTGSVYAYGAVSGMTNAAGLLAEGISTALLISECCSMGNVYSYQNSGNMNGCGGALGYVTQSGSTISYCYAMGNVYHFSVSSESQIGGFAGRLEHSVVVSCSFATGNTNLYCCNANTWGRSCGFVGSSMDHCSIANCFATGNVYLHASGDSCNCCSIANSWNDSNISNAYYNSESSFVIEPGERTPGLQGTGVPVNDLKGEIVKTTISGFAPAENDPWKYIDGDYPALKSLTKNPSTPSAIETDYEPNLKLSDLSLSDPMSDSFGTWAWSIPTTNIVAGEFSYEATFSPSDPRWYNSATRSISVTVNKADLICNAPKGFTLFYDGEATLNDLELVNPNGNTSGTWAWKDTSTSVGGVGTRTFPANFTPTDTSNYNLVSEDFNIKVAVIAVPSGTTALLGQTLEEVAIKNPAGNIVGTWVWSDESTPVGAIGSKTFAASFVPANHNYDSSAETNVSVRVVNMSSGMLPINGSGNNSLKMNLSAAITENESTSYQWQRSDDKNASEELWENCTGTGNDTDTYVLEDSDYNYFVRLKVTYTPAGSSEQTLYSNPVKMMFKWGSLSWS